jgi:hypothetical protein
MIPAELDTGPPEMRHPGWLPGRRQMSIFRADDRHYPDDTQLSSPLVRLACTALSAEELAEWLACRHISPGEDEPCP